MARLTDKVHNSIIHISFSHDLYNFQFQCIQCHVFSKNNKIYTIHIYRSDSSHILLFFKGFNIMNLLQLLIQYLDTFDRVPLYDKSTVYYNYLSLFSAMITLIILSISIETENNTNNRYG